MRVGRWTRQARRVLAPVGAVALVAALTSAAWGQPIPNGDVGQLASQQPPVPKVTSIAHSTVAMNTLPIPHNPAPAATTAAVWPTAGDATTTVPAATKAAAVPATAGSLPITVTPATPAGAKAMAMSVAPAGTTEHVHLTDQGSARKAGVTGLLFSVTPARPGAVSVGLGYAAFRNAGGADYGYRLHLVTMPACALTTPSVRACQTQTALPTSSNNAKADVVTATVPLTTAGTVLAAVAGPGGPNGTFQSSSLKPSGSWSVTGASGNFTWQYPIDVPPPASGVAPDIALGYSAQAVDGETAGTNTQTSWVGEGWDYSPGSIERTYRTCSDDTTLPAAEQTGDQCWAGQIVTLNFNGQSTALVQDANDPNHSWHVAADNGDRVELLNHDPADNPQSGQYWKITTTDGTQYFFGRDNGPGSGPTNATWTEPVYGAHPGDPCYNATFAKASCSQVWRWNLDYVEDTHGNVTMYYYTPETNYYGADNATSGVLYTRGGYLNRIDYGLRDENNTDYGQPAPDQVNFTVADRCSLAGTCDTPTDQQCASGATCNVHSPTFWTSKHLTTIATQYRNGAGYTAVDSYALNQQFNADGDPAMWLNSITRTGTAADGSTITLPPVSFAGQLMDNRVAGYNSEPGMIRYRMTNITEETGERINITYTKPECTATNVPAVPSQNTMRCFPVYWTLPYQSQQTLDYFHKYVTAEVDVQDPDGLSPTQVTTYTYPNGPAWHYDDNELVKPANRTYGQYRGYGTVEVRTGTTPDQQTLTTSTYFLGMDGDTLPGGATRSASVKDSLGEMFPDANQYADNPLEVQVFNGDGGARVSSTITEPTTVATTATRTRSGLPPQLAQIVREGNKRVLTDLAGGGVRTTTTAYTYDSTGRVTQETASGDGVPTVCTATSYADNTTSWIRQLPSEVATAEGSCPAGGASILKDVRTYYDDAALGQVPGAGDATHTETATGNDNGNLTFATTQSTTYDASGRTLSTTDARGKTTDIAYTPADGGNLTTTVTTNPLGQTSSVTVDPGHGTTLSTVDVAGHRTDAAYDALGRLTAEWLPGHDKSAGAQASTTYSYGLRQDGPETVTTNTLVDTGAGTDYTTSIALSDALGQPIQTQAEAEGGGRVVTDTFHDSHGWVSRTNNRYYTDGAASTTLISVADDEVSDRTITTYDGTGRAVLAAEYNGKTLSYSTRTVYGGDRTTTIPPTGGVTRTTVTDALGNTIDTLQYSTAPTVTGSVVSGGTYTSTTEQYDPLGQPTKVTDADKNVWTTGYNMLGQTTTTTSPDSGTTTYTYDPDNNIASSTDARGQTLAYTYDDLDRKTGEYSGSTTGAPLASWEWDTVQPGKLTSMTRFTPQGQFLIGVSHYDSAGNPSNNIVSIPSSVPGLGATYTTTFAYTTTNLVSQITPAVGGGLDGNAISMGYDAFGNQITSRGDQVYLGAASYTPFGEPAQYTLGTLNDTAWLTYDRDPQTRRLTDANFSVQAATPQIDDLTYTYDASGNTTSTTDLQGPAGSATETQCDRYDALDRLTAAWTANDDCANQNPTTANIGGPQPFWDSWAFDPTGLRTGQTQHALHGSTGGDTTTTYTYPTGGTNQPDALTNTTTGDNTTGYAYDADGNATTMGNQNLTWDAENHLASDKTPNGTTSYVYDPDGTELLADDPNSITLFLPDEDLTYSKSTQVVTGTRYIAVNGQTIVDHTAGANPVYVAGDPHGTQSVAWDPVAQTTTRRTFDPYGNQIGQTSTTGGGAGGPGQWPGQRQFLNDPVDGNTGLTDVGARQYDSTTGRFISVDPTPDPTEPQSLNSYTYGDDNPNTLSDPTGMHVAQDPGGYVAAPIPPVNTGLFNTLKNNNAPSHSGSPFSSKMSPSQCLHDLFACLNIKSIPGLTLPKPPGYKLPPIDPNSFLAHILADEKRNHAAAAAQAAQAAADAKKKAAEKARPKPNWLEQALWDFPPTRKAMMWDLTHTVAVCANGSASFGGAGSVSACAGMSDGRWVTFESSGFGVGTPGVSAWDGLMVSNESPDDLKGWSNDVGVDAGEGVSVNGETGSSGSNWSFELGAGVGLYGPLPAGADIGRSYTQVQGGN